MRLIWTLLLASLPLFAVGLLKAYASVPAKELKRRARHGDELAQALYRASGFGYSLEVLLWVFIGTTAALFFVVTTQLWPPLISVALSVLLIWAAFLWLPASKSSKIMNRIAAISAPFFAKSTALLLPVLARVARIIKKHHPITIHTGLYERSDLLELLQSQKVQAGNRIEESELAIAASALTFGDKFVREVLVPRRIVTCVAANASVGPILMAELHKSGHSRFPVYEGKKDNIVGTLYLRDVVGSKKSGTVASCMRSNSLSYLHEDQPLTEALSAMVKHHRHLMIVVNSFEEYVGIVTLEDIIEQILGQKIVDEFDQYEDIRAVAQKIADKEHAKHS